MPYSCGQQIFCRDLDKIALTVPSGIPVLFAIFRAPIPLSWFSERTVRTVSSGRGGLPSLLPLARATLSPAIVRSDILALSCFAKLANRQIIIFPGGACGDLGKARRAFAKARQSDTSEEVRKKWLAEMKEANVAVMKFSSSRLAKVIKGELSATELRVFTIPGVGHNRATSKIKFGSVRR